MIYVLFLIIKFLDTLFQRRILEKMSVAYFVEIIGYFISLLLKAFISIGLEVQVKNYIISLKKQDLHITPGKNYYINWFKYNGFPCKALFIKFH
jgi:hypothetical protein